MQNKSKVCPTCGKEKTLVARICRSCLHKEIREALAPLFGERNKEIVEATTKRGERATNVATRLGLSRERVRQILAKNGVNYRDLIKKWGAEKEAEEEIERKKKRQKFCRFCGKPFEIKTNGATVVFCSNVCKINKGREHDRINARLRWRRKHPQARPYRLTNHLGSSGEKQGLVFNRKRVSGYRYDKQDGRK